MLGARKKSERETRKLRCAKPSAPKSSRRRMKPILDRTKSKAEAYAPGAAPKGTFPSPFQFSPFLAGISETACCGRRSGSQAAVRCASAMKGCSWSPRFTLSRRRCPLWVISRHGDMSTLFYFAPESEHYFERRRYRPGELFEPPSCSVSSVFCTPPNGLPMPYATHCLSAR